MDKLFLRKLSNGNYDLAVGEKHGYGVIIANGSIDNIIKQLKKGVSL